MDTNRKAKLENDRWASQRGAALITTLLLSTLLLVGGGALIMSTSMSTLLAVDSTAELQAYYSAEAGMNAAVNVLRRNVQSNPVGTSATFRNAVSNPSLSTWFTYGATINGTSVISLSSTAPVTGYTISVSDPDSTPVGTEPNRLLLRVTGYGPSGSMKRLEAMVDRRIFDFTTPATIFIRGNDDGTTTIPTFNIGNSNAKEYSGYDHLHPTTSIPVFGTTHANDFTSVTNEINSAKPSTVSGVEKVKQFTNSETPTFLQTADNARAFLDTMQATAVANGRYFTSTPSDYGSTASPKFTFVNGDASLSDGCGLLVVTGTLTASGNVGFNGIILVIGDGVFQRNGGGNGDTYGAIIVAKVGRTSGNFGSPIYNMNGGGNSTTEYDSDQVTNALNSVGLRALAIREY